MEGFPLPKYYNVPVYEEGEIKRWISQDEAFDLSGRLYASGAAMYEIRVDPQRPWREELHKLEHPKDNNSFSPCAISFNETKANAGEVKQATCLDEDEDENKRRAGIARAQIKRAQRKVYEWDKEGLDRPDYIRAVTITAGRVHRPNLGQEGL